MTKNETKPPKKKASERSKSTPASKRFQVEVRTDVRTLRFLVRLLRVTTAEARLTLSRTAGLLASTVDPSHVSMLSVHLPSLSVVFPQSDSPDIDRVDLGIDLVAIENLLFGKKSTTPVVVDFWTPYRKDDLAVFRFPFEEAKCRSIDPEELRWPEVPNIHPTTEIVVPASAFCAAVRAAYPRMNRVALRIRDRRLGLFFQDRDATVAKVIPGDGPNAVDSVGSVYAVDLLFDFLVTTSGDLTVGFGVDYPLRITFENDIGSVSYLLAPHVEDGAEANADQPPVPTVDDPKDWPEEEVPEDAPGPKMSEVW